MRVGGFLPGIAHGAFVAMLCMSMSEPTNSWHLPSCDVFGSVLVLKDLAQPRTVNPARVSFHLLLEQRHCSSTDDSLQ